MFKARVQKFKAIWMLALLLLLPLLAWAGEAEREAMLDMGLRSNEAYSLSLLDKARSAEKEAEVELLAEAMEHSPDVPGLYFELAKASLPNVLKSLSYCLNGIKAYSKNFWWPRSLFGLLYVSALLSLALSLAVVAFMRFPVELKYIVHDINEDRKKLIVPGVLVLLSFTSPLFCIASALMLAGLYAKNIVEKSVVYIALGLIVFSPILLKPVNVYFSSSTPALRAMAAVNQGRDNVYATEVLEGEKDFGPRFSYALALKREGRVKKAISIYEDLLGADPGARVYTNLANAHIAAGKMDLAKDNYGKALELEPSATLYYNLSQAYRGTYELDAGNKYYDEAVKLDSDAVSGFMAIASRNPNRFVMDRTLTVKELKEFANKRAETVISLFHLPAALSSFLAAAMVALFIIMDKKTVNRSSSCPECGRVVCPLCARKENVSKRCDECYKIYMEDTSPQGRVKRMFKAKELKNRIVGRVRLLSFVSPPGTAQIYAGRQLAGLLFLWPALFCITTLVLNPLFSTGLAGFGHSWLIPPFVFVFAVLYVISIISVARRLHKGWL